jgi:hypothetical protein
LLSNKLRKSTSKKQSKIFKFEDKILTFSDRLSVLITVFQFFDDNSVVRQHNESKNIQKNKLRQSTSKKQLKIFKFEEKISAFSARLSVLITVFQVIDSNSFLLSQKTFKKIRLEKN